MVPGLVAAALSFINLIAVILWIPESLTKEQKEQRKKSVQGMLVKISKTDAAILKQRADEITNSIINLKQVGIPESMITLLKFYLLSKARLPTQISKNEILEHLNQERDDFTSMEIEEDIWLTG